MLTKIDRYILGKFMKTFFFSITLILLIFIVFDIKDKMPTFTTKDIPLREIVFDYYLMFIPYYGNLFSPLFTFIAVIFFTSRMATQSEFIAILCSGTSFRRMLRPYLAGAFILAFSSLVLNHFVFPRAFKIKIGFEDKWINNNYNTDAHNMLRKVGPNKILYIESYENKLKTGYRVSVEEIVKNKQVYFLTADFMVWDSVNAVWNFNNVKERRLIAQDRLDTLGNRKPIYSQVNKEYSLLPVKLDFVPADMWRYESKIEAMTFFQLRDYIQQEKQRGSNLIPKFEVEMYKRTSFPFATFILTIIAVCVSSKKVRGGVGLQIALGLFLSCIYIMLMYVFTTIATTGFSSTLLGVWIPNIVFSFVALYFYKTAQK